MLQRHFMFVLIFFQMTVVYRFCQHCVTYFQFFGLFQVSSKNNTGTFIVRVISKAQKVQSFLKCRRGPFLSFENPVCFKIGKKLKGAPFGDKKNSKVA